MLDFVFVMVVSTTIPESFVYDAHYRNCIEGHLYVSLHYPNANATRCLHQDYIHLPKDTIIIKRDMKNNAYRYYDVHPSCWLKRNCEA